MLLGNKIDLCQNGKLSKSDDMAAYVREHGFVQFFVTSARDGTNIDEAARALVTHIMNNKIEARGVNDDKGVVLDRSSVAAVSAGDVEHKAAA